MLSYLAWKNLKIDMLIDCNLQGPSSVVLITILAIHIYEEVSLDSVNLRNNSMDTIPLRKVSVPNLIVTCCRSTRSTIESLEGRHTKARLVTVVISELIEG